MVIDVLDRGDLPFPRSLPEFQCLFPDEATCAAYLERARWSDGFICDHCGSPGEPYRFANRPGVFRCRHFNRDTSLTAGTPGSRLTRQRCKRQLDPIKSNALSLSTTKTKRPQHKTPQTAAKPRGLAFDALVPGRHQGSNLLETAIKGQNCLHAGALKLSSGTVFTRI